MKRFLHCVVSNKKYSFTNHKRRTVCGLVLTAVFSVFSLSAKSVFTDNYSDNSTCFFNTELEGQRKFISNEAVFLAVTPDQITVNDVTNGNSSNCINFNGNIIVDASGSNPDLNLEYSIDGGMTFQLSNVFQDLAAATYNVVVRYEDGTCPIVHGDVVVMGANAPIISSVSGTNVTNCGSDNGSFFIEATGDGALEFSVDNGVNYVFSGFFSNLPAGDYTVLVRSVGTDCVSNPEFRTITEPISPIFEMASPTNLTGCSFSDGQITITASAGTNGNYEFTVDGGASWQSMATFMGLGAGEYTPGVRNADDDTCPDYGEVIILTAPDAPKVEASTVSPPSTCLASDGVITVNISNGDVNNLEFSINNGLTWEASNTFNGLAGGNYNIRVRTLDQTCFVDGPLVNLPGGTEPNITGDFTQSISNCGGNDGLITILVDNDNGSFEYSIDNGVTFQEGNSFSGLVAGSYPVVVRGGDGSCPVNGPTFELMEPESPTIQDVAVNQTASCTEGNSSIIITATGGQGSYSMSIDNGANFFFTNTFENVADGTYTIIVRNANGTCEVTHPEAIFISEGTAPTFNGITASPATSCVASDGNISVNLPTGGTGSYEYSIDNGATWQASNFFGGLSAGDYLLGIRNDDGTCPLLENAAELSSSGSATIDNITFTNPIDCDGTDGTISIEVSGANTYEYSIDGVNFQASNTFAGLGSGTYTATVRINDGNCPVTSDPIILSTNGGVITGVFPNNPSSCSTDDGSITIEATGDNIVYSINGIDFQASGLFENLAAGTYEISIRNADGTCMVFGSIETLNSTEEPAIPTYFTENPTGCNTIDGSITVQVQNDNGTFQYSIDGGITFQNENTFTGLGGGEYNIVITSSVCETNGGAISLLEPTEPTIGTADFQNPTSCDGNDGFIIVTGTGEGDLEYSIDGGLSWQFFGTFNGLNTGVYTPAVRNQFMGTCPVIGENVNLSTPDQVTINDVTSSNPSSCEATDGSISVSAGGGTEVYEYSIDNGMTFQTENLFTGLNIGTYIIRVRNSDGTCGSSSEMIQLTAVGAPVVETPLSTQPSECGATDGIIVITASGGSENYEYSINGGNSYVSNNTFTSLAAGTYTVLVRNADGTCAVNAGIVQLNSTDSPTLNPTFSQGTSDCNGVADGLITIQASNDDGTFEYSIDGGTTYQSSNQFSTVAAGTYDIFVRKGNSTCIVNGGSVTIDEPTRPTLISATPNEASCGEANGRLIIEAQGGLPAYEYTIDGGATWVTENTFEGLSTGTYTPGVRNADSDCSTIGDVVFVNEDDEPTFEGAVGENPSGTGTDNGTITVSAISCGNNTLEYSIDGGLTWQTSNFFGLLPPGVYQVDVRNVGDTESIGNFEVVLTEPDVSACPEIVGAAVTGPTSSTSNNGSIVISVSGDDSMLQYSIDGGVSFSSTGTFENLGEGTYQILIQNEDGTCQESGGTVNLTGGNTGSTDLTLDSTNPTGCDVANGTITITAPIDFSYLYSIDGNDYQESPDFTDLGAGSYTVSALDILTNEEIFFASNPLVLTTTDGPQATTTPTNPTCGTTEGVITFTANGGNGTGYEYSIDGGISWSNEATFSNLAAGNYNPMVRNADGTCPTMLAAIDLIQIGTISVDNIETTDIGCDVTFGSITITANGGDGSLEYSIDGGTTWQSNNTFTNLNAGTYDISVSNADGTCQTAGGQVEVQMVSDLVIVNVQSVPIGCGETTGSLTISASGADNILYSIDGGANFSPFDTFNDLPVGTYTIVVQDATGACITQGGEVMVENIGGTVIAIEGVTTNNPSGCATPDGEITVDVNNVDNLEFSIDGGLNYQSSNIFTGLPEGAYEIFVRNNDGSCATAYQINPVQLTNDEQVLFVEQTITVNVEDLLPGGKVCVPAQIGQLVAYNLVLNGEEYTEQLLGCDDIELTGYPFFQVIAQSDGPYNIVEWICNGGNFSGVVDNLEGVVNQMNIWDPTGNWQLIPGNTVLGGEQGGFYSNMTVSVNGQTIGVNVGVTTLPNGTCIQVDGEGTYELVATNDSGCTDSITIIVEGDIVNPPNPNEGEGDTIFISTPMNIPTNPYCFAGDNLPTGVIQSLGFCGDAMNGGVPVTDAVNNCIAYFPTDGFMGQDEFCVFVCQEGDATGIICDTTIFIVSVHPPTNTVDVTVNTLETLEYCLEDPILTLPGNIISGEICGSNDTEITATITDNCVTFDPVDGYFGLTEVCIVLCDDSTPNSICDTTYFNVAVTPECPDIFAEEETTITSLFPTTAICIPISQANLATDYQIIVDGNAIPVDAAPCDVDTIYNYPYGSIPTGEPVSIDEWVCNGQTFSFDLPDISNLIDSMQFYDPAGNWTVDLENSFITGNPEGEGCGDMMATLLNGDATNIFAQFTFNANGGEIILDGFGVHTIMITDLIGCTDILTVNLNEDLEGEFITISTPFQTQIDEVCGDTTALVGNWDGALGYCSTPTDGTAPILPGIPCASYTPLNDFVGLDTLCLTVCDDIPFPNTTCINTTYIIQTLPPTDTIFIDAPTISAFDTCLVTTDFLQLPGNLTSSTLCGFNADEVEVTIEADTCLTIDLASTFGLGTTEICIVHCDDTNPVFCDTTYIIVTGTVECDDFIAVSDTMLITDMGVSTLCLPDILTAEIGAGIYTVELDGEPFAGPIGGCDFVDAFIFQTVNIPAGPFTSVSWTVNGVDFEGMAEDIAGIVDLMNMWDSAGNWTFENIGNSIFGGVMDNEYSSLSVDNGIGPVTVAAGTQQIPGGSQFVFVEAGEHILVITNNETGCDDTVNINVLDGSITILIETPQNEPDTTCFNIVADYPNFDSLNICGQPLNGTFEILDDSCFIYIPNIDYLGEDEGCISICSTIDGMVQCDTFDVIIDVIPNCEENLIVADNIVLMLEDCDATIPYCLDVNGADLTGYTITDNGTPIDATIDCGGEILGGFYDYSTIPGLLAFGDFAVDSVNINGTTYSGGFTSATALDDSLNVWDVAAAWSSNFTDSRLENATTTGMYDTLYITDILLDTQFVLPYFIDTNGGDNGISLDLTTGIHQITFTNPITTCTDVVNINVMCDDMNGCPELAAISDLEIIMPDCDFPVLFCISASVDSMINYTVTDNGNPYTAGFTDCPDALNSAALTLNEGEHNLVFTRNDGTCVEEIFVDVRCIQFVDTEIDVTVNLGQSDILCLYDDLDIDTTGIISITNICDPNTNDNVTFTIDTITNCITLDPLMIGLDTACLEICNEVGCILVTINVEVLEQCDDLFALDNIGMGITDCSEIEGEVCLPILMSDLVNTDIFVGGVLYTGTRTACDVDSIYTMLLSDVPAGGQLGPYALTFDIVDMDGMTTTFVDTVDVIEDALTLFNTADPFSTWIYQATPEAFVGGSPLNTYTLTVVQISSQETAILGVNINLNPNGTAITVPVGTADLIFEDQITGCRDTLLSTVACVTTDSLFLTLGVGMLDTLCFDTLDLPGNLVTFTNDCPQLSGTNASVIVIGNTPAQGDSLCVSFAGLEVGEDQACIVLCDDLGVCDTTYVFITVTSGDIDLPVAVADSTVTGQNQPVVFNPFANDMVNGLLDTFYIVTQPNFGAGAFSPDGTINYVPQDGYCDPAMPDSLQYAICNTIGCDTAWAYITVDCGGIEVFNGFSPNGDGVNDNFMIRGVEGFGESTLEIYNRWGNRVHNVINYQNDWRGTWDGKDLPDGTYFYILKLNDASQDVEVYSGYLEINR